MSTELDIRIVARDEASKVLQGLNRELGGLGKGGQQASQQLGTVDRALGSAKTAAVGFGAAMATAFVTDKIVNFARTSVSAATDLNETISKSNQVFGDNAAQVQSWADSTATSIGISEEASLSAASTLADLFKTMGTGLGPATQMSQRMVELSADVASFHNAAGGAEEVLAAMRSGLIGESEPMRRFGVILNEASVQAKALELGLAGSTAEISEADKVVARYNIILEQTASAHGDFARTMDDQANQARIAQAQWEDMQATIGQGLLPAVVEVTRASNDMMSSSLFQGGVEVATGQLATMASTAGTLRDAIDGAAGPIGDAVEALDSLGPISEAAGDGVGKFAVALPGVGLLKSFSDGIDDGREALERLGIVTADRASFDPILDWIDEAVQKAILLSDAFRHLKLLELRDDVVEAVGAFFKQEEAIEAVVEVTDRATAVERQRRDAVEDATIATIEQAEAEMSRARALADAVEQARTYTQEGHRYNEMVRDSAGAFDEASVSLAFLLDAQNDLAAANDFSRQAIDATRGAVNLWEADIRANEEAIKALDGQLADGNITVDEHAEKVGILTGQNERLANGIRDDLVPQWIDARVRGAELQQELDDLDTLFKDGKISQQEYAAKSAEIRDEQEKLANPMQTIIEKLETIIDRLIEADGIDPHIEMTADTDAVIEAIESMRRYAANNPINVPIHGVVAGGNDAPTYIQGGSAGGNDREVQSNLSLRSNKAAWFADGVEKGKAFGTGVGEGIMSASPVISDAGKEGGREYGEEFEGEFLLTWNEMWVKASQDAARIFENDIMGLMDGSAADAALAAAEAAEAFMESWIEAGFSPDAPAYKEAQERFEEAMAEYAIITGIAGTEAAQEFWEAWERENAERQYPEQAAREAAENIWRSPGWEDAGIEAGGAFFGAFGRRVGDDMKAFPAEIATDPVFRDGWGNAGEVAGQSFADTLADALHAGLEQSQQQVQDELMDLLHGDEGSGPGGSPSSSPGGGGGGGPAATLSDPSMNVFDNLAMLASDSYADMVLDLLGLVTPRDKKKGSLGNNADALYIAEFLNRIPFFMGSPSQISEAEFQEWFDYALGNPSAAAKLAAMPFDAFLAELQDGPPIGMATGGYITGEGLAMLHPNEYITPDRSIPQLAQEIVGALRGGMDGMNGNQPINVVINLDSQTIANKMHRSTVPGMTLGVDV